MVSQGYRRETILVAAFLAAGVHANCSRSPLRVASFQRRAASIARVRSALRLSVAPPVSVVHHATEMLAVARFRGAARAVHHLKPHCLAP